MRYLIFALVFLLGLVFPFKAWAADASLKCQPATGNYRVGDVFTIEYFLDTRDVEALGADIVATYDPTVLEASSSSSTTATTDTQWEQPVTNTVDTSLGKIQLDYGNSQPGFSGQSVIGQLTFKALTAGQTQFNFTFFQAYDDTTPGVAKVWGKKDGTNTTNVLNDVGNCIYVVESAVGSTSEVTPTVAPQATVTAAPTISELPRAGNTDIAISVMTFSFILTSVGIAVPTMFKWKKR